MKIIMKQLTHLAAVLGTVLGFSLGEKPLARAQGMDPQQIQNIIQQFQNMSPEQLENMRRASESIDPEQRQAIREEFLTMDPQSQMDFFKNFSTTDPQQLLSTLQKRRDASLRERMKVTNDEEWSLITARIAAVKKAQAALIPYRSEMLGLGRMGRFAGRGGGAEQATPEVRALTQATDSDAATSETETESLLAKFRAARQEKQTALVAAQNDLRALLTVRQEAIATMSGLLD